MNIVETHELTKRSGMHKKVSAAWDRTKARRNESGAGRDEQGSILILAMIFLVVIGMTIASLANWTMNDLDNTNSFVNARATTYSATSVANVAVQSMRYKPCDGVVCGANTPPSTALGECWVPAAGGPAGVSQLTTDGVTIAIWCSTAENLNSAATRVVDLYACVSTLTSASSPSTISAAETACGPTGRSRLHVQVTFDDYPQGGGSLLTVQCSTLCGGSTILDTWTWA
jgi:hypothetical protein